MRGSLTYGRYGVVDRDRTRTLFGQTMGFVAITAAFFALGSYAGRDLAHGVAIAAYIAAFVCLLIMRFTVRRSATASTVLLLVFGMLIGVAVSPTLTYYAATNPRILWQAGGATALFVAAFGAIGYLTRRDLSWLARISFLALLALFVFGIVLIFVRIPHGSLLYSGLGLVVLAGLTMVDFQRLRRSQGLDSAPLLAASIKQAYPSAGIGVHSAHIGQSCAAERRPLSAPGLRPSAAPRLGVIPSRPPPAKGETRRLVFPRGR